MQLLQQESITYTPKETYSDGLSSICIPTFRVPYLTGTSEGLRAANREQQTKFEREYKPSEYGPNHKFIYKGKCFKNQYKKHEKNQDFKLLKHYEIS